MIRKNITRTLTAVAAAIALTACAAPPPAATRAPAATAEPTVAATTEATAEPTVEATVEATAAPTAEATTAATEMTGTLAGTQWVLTTLNGNPPITGTEITLDFGTDGSVSGSDGCNRIMGTYTQTAMALSFGPLASTMMACPDDISKQAKTLQDALAVTQSFTDANGTLGLIHTGNAVIATFASASAAATTPATTPVTGTLAGTQWVLGTLGGNTPITETQITLNFGDDGRVSGSDGCNRITGTYTEAGESLTFGPMASTMMACPEKVTAQATIFNTALQNTQTFTQTDTELTLLRAGAPLATFTRLSTQLAGTKWQVTNFNNGKEAVIGVLEGITLTVEFGTDGSVAGSAGCNNFTGGFTQKDATVAIGPLASTMKMCTEPAGVMEQEAQFVKALESAATYQFDGDMLSFRTKDDALAVVLRRAP